MLVLGDKFKNEILKKTGLSAEQISSMGTKAINTHLEARLSKELPMGYPHDSMSVRGCVYINHERLILPEETERKISLI